MKLHSLTLPSCLGLLLNCVLIGAVPAAGAAGNPGASSAPVVVSGTVADEASKAGLLARLRDVFGAERVIDQLSIGTVSSPANWDDYLQKLIGPNLKLISRGQLKIDGNAVSMRGDVASEAQRLQIGSAIAASLNPTYTVNNGLRVALSEQSVLDAALAERIIEFESGKAELTESGKRILDEMSLALNGLTNKTVEIIGHTDNAGSRAGNMSLSQARAEAVKAYVTKKGIDPALMSVSGEGPDRPIADNRSAEGRARNRRIEFKIAN
jgi:OOP family OmpA-OmpF porin